MINNYSGISGSRVAYLAAAELKKNGKALIVVSSGRVAARLAEDLAFFVPEAEIVIMPEEGDVQVLYEARNREALIMRIRGIQALCTRVSEPDSRGDKGENCSAVIAPISAVLKKTEGRSRFINSVISIKTEMKLNPEDLKEKLLAAGYESLSVCESPGEFSSRGGIIDIFSPSHSKPVRVEFFDDVIDSIRFYDCDTQRSTENLKAIVLGPAAEFIPNEEEKSFAITAIEKEYDKRILSIKKEQYSNELKDGRIDKLEEHKRRVKDIFDRGSNVQIYTDFIDYFDVDKHFLWEYLKDGINILCDPTRLKEEVPSFQNKNDINAIFSENCSIYTPFPEAIQGIEKIDYYVNIRSRQIAAFNGQVDLFAAELAKFCRDGYNISIVCSSSERAERIKEYIDIAEIYGDIKYIIGSLSSGMIFDDEKLCFITEADIFPQFRKKTVKKKKSNGSGLQFADLHKGDYVVHEAHGIGRFEGIKTMTAAGITKDYIVIRYAGSDVLYIPTEQLDIIQKYIGSGGNSPQLSKLSGGSWKRAREKARKAIMEIAEDLVRLYAQREASGGYAFSEDTVWQTEFEADFPYTETDDQLKAIEEIKEDMQKPLPMDRLLCGDVGYGKTEVAARAIFKCISEGKQAAILAPTTLLVNQHFHNLKERFSNFPFEIAELSRFRTTEQQKKTIRALEEGNVDLVIGTHRLLSRDVHFKDFGLLVIDEEQRFGVQHKEAIKKLKNNVDVLTLSATPIPRTLNMSLTGIKDISTINEPPSERYPVQTYVSQYDEELLKAAIERELSRGGQVFVVNNRITGIRSIAESIMRLVPEASVGIGHGRMSEEALENTMIDFVDGDTNVLVATTIIENGIDIPNANTMIILNADKLGLAQLYQLRGRVGRSNRMAYAYLMYQPQKVLTEIACQRLAAIREFTEFGSGFKLAMRDLELRGAGNILGEAQSGHVEGIGYELYCKEIDRAVRQLRGEKVTEARAEITIDINASASIPAYYINDESLRLQAYKKISGISSQHDADEMLDELVDRYGDLPDDTINLIRIAEIRAHAEALGVEEISDKGSKIIVRFGEVNNLNAYMYVIAKEEIGETLTLLSGNTPELRLFTGKRLALVKLLELMQVLRNALETSQETDKQV